jgi:hypothetical protein
VRAAKDYLIAAPAAVRGRLDVPLDVIDDRLYLEPRDADQLDELAGALGVTRSIERMQQAIASALR